MKKHSIITGLLIDAGICLAALALGGCSGAEPFMAGFVSGATTLKVMSDEAQKEFKASLEMLKAEKAEIDAIIAQLPADDPAKAALQAWVDEQTLESIEELSNTDWKDPKVIIGYGLALLSLITAGYQKYQRMSETPPTT